MIDTAPDLRRVPLFAGLTDTALTAIAELAEPIDFVDGEALTTEGADGDAFYLIVEGRVEVTRGDQALSTLGAGDFIGEIALVDGRPRTATATADGPVHGLVIRRDGFLALMDRFGAVRLGILMALTERVRADERAASA